MSDLTFGQYAARARETAIYPGAGEGDMEAMTYLALGLAGEAGEVAGKVKKVMRDRDGVIRAADRAELLYELGDVQWYLAQLVAELGFPPDQAARSNILKLEDRAARGVLGGSGDSR